MTASTLSYSQITLENTYQGGEFKTAMVNLVNSGKKYAIMDNENGTVKLYNLDHSLFKSMSFPISSSSSGSYIILYITDNTFNLDNKIEYMVDYQDDDNWSQSKTTIYNEDGDVVFEKDGETPMLEDFFLPKQTGAIYNTDNGTKMILNNHVEHSSKIYSLPGSLPTTLVNPESKDYDINVFPNPANDYFKINYSLPDNVKIARVDVFDMNGKIVKTYKVDNAFQDLLINTSELSSGTYICRVSSDKQKLSETKFVVNK